MTEETNSEVAEALQAVGEKTGGEVAVEAAEAEQATEEVSEVTEEFAQEQLEEMGLEDKPADTESERYRLRAMIEAAVYVSEEPLTIQQLTQALSQPKDVVEGLLNELLEAYAAPHHGIAVREVAGGYKMSTKPEFHEDIRTFVKKLKPPLKLSLAALETLAVVAYKQPVTGPEILEIRGVQGGGVLKTLLERKLITAAGRKQVVGKPVLYKTTKDFLLQFGLKDLAELPTLKEFEEWSRLALGDDAGETPKEEPKPEPEAEPTPPPASEQS
jgi:segregation and condensation protein B